MSKRGGAHYSTAAFHLISAIHNDTRNKQIVCCRNDGAVPLRLFYVFPVDSFGEVEYTTLDPATR